MPAAVGARHAAAQYLKVTCLPLHIDSVYSLGMHPESYADMSSPAWDWQSCVMLCRRMRVLSS